MHTIHDIIEHFAKRVSRADCELLIAYVLDTDRTFVIAHGDTVVEEKKKKRVHALLIKRAQNVPLAYLTGTKEFYGRPFIVSPDVLVPRPETEILVDAVLSTKTRHNITHACFCDIGTGSGIIPLTLAKELHDDKNTFIATDISRAALSVAKQNAHRFDVPLTFVHDDVCGAKVQHVLARNQHKHLFLTANLPYVDVAHKADILAHTDAQSLVHEPQNALWAPDNGLFFYKKCTEQIIAFAHENPTKKIFIFYEIDQNQTTEITKDIHRKTHKNSVRVITDLAGKNRVIAWHIGA